MSDVFDQPVAEPAGHGAAEHRYQLLGPDAAKQRITSPLAECLSSSFPPN